MLNSARGILFDWHVPDWLYIDLCPPNFVITVLIDYTGRILFVICLLEIPDEGGANCKCKGSGSDRCPINRRFELDKSR